MNFVDYDEMILGLAIVFLLNRWGLSGSALTGGSGFAVSIKEVDSKLCDGGTNDGTNLDGHAICFTVAVGLHVFNSVDLSR